MLAQGVGVPSTKDLVKSVKYESLWQHYDPDYKPRPSLSNTVEVDIAIIGGGITGVSTAYHVSKSGTSFVLLEKGIIGGGSTGRSGGILSPGVENDLAMQSQSSLLESRRNMENLVRIIVENGIECGLAPTDANYMAVHRSHTKRFKTEARSARAAGMRTEIATEATLKNTIGEGIYGILAYKGYGYRLNPLLLVRGLASLAEKQGTGRIYENTTAKRIKRLNDGRYMITTENGAVIAKKYYLATEASETDLKKTPQGLIKLRVNSIATKPLSMEAIRNAGMTPGEIYFDTKRLYTFVRVNDDGRIMVDGGDHVLNDSDGDVNAKVSNAIIEGLLGALYRMFPKLKGTIDVEYAWQGNIGVTRRRMPAIGNLHGDQNAKAACGFEGHGLVRGFECGQELAVQANSDIVSMKRREMLRGYQPIKRIEGTVLMRPAAEFYIKWLSMMDKREQLLEERKSIKGPV